MSTAAPALQEAARCEIAVNLHAIEPATFERCALIRDWLSDHDIARVTLLVVPAPDLHPLADRSSELVDWLVERRGAGDAIAQCGFTGSCASHRAWRGRGEFAGLDAGETRRAVDAGWRVLRLAGVEPAGFVAPGYGYTRPLHEALARRFSWWLDARRIYAPRAPAGGAPLAPVISPSGWQAAAGRPAALRRRAALRSQLLRVDLHPEELRPRQVRGLDELLGNAAGRSAVTAPELAARVAQSRGGRLSGATSA